MTMAGTNHKREMETAGAAPVFILVAPQMGENIGAAARAMWNFGLDRMRLVAPRDGWPNPKAQAMASGAARVLDRVGLFDDTRAACADLTHVFATTARDRSLAKTVMTPERAMSEARDMIAAGERVRVVFGPERSGLETADVVPMGDDLSRIPYTLSLSRRTRRTLMVNLGISLRMIVLMVGFILTVGLPLPLAVLGHEGGTVLVSLNGLRLLAARPD